MFSVGLSADQVEPGDASADQVKPSDIVGGDVLSSCGKCECAFHVVLAFGVSCLPAGRFSPNCMTKVKRCPTGA